MNKSTFGLTRLVTATFTIASVLLMVGCYTGTQPVEKQVVPKDGEILLPQAYQNWPKFVKTIDKPSGHVREIYMNPTGQSATKGEGFPSATQSVMEIYVARKNAAGDPLLDDNGRMIKGSLEKIFVMEKGDGWGQAQPAGTIDNGDWVYAAYLADGVTAATDDFSGCRGCHAPLVDADFVHRYDEHFQ